MLTDQIMYEALVSKDETYEGSFIAAVKTTGIFCRPTCTARKPKKENVEFFRTTREAIIKGYRPCKVCNPLQVPHATPAGIQSLLDDLNKDPSRKFKDWDILQRGIEPSMIRRWFLRNHGVTFHAYQRMFRLNAAFRKIQQGDSITSAAFDSGYDSLSGFNESFRTVFGFPPSVSRKSTVINMCRLESPLGTMFACAVDAGICLLEYSDRKMLETEVKTIARLFNANIVQAFHPHFDLLKKQLEEYFAGKRKKFDVPLAAPGTAFQEQVWHELQNIPYGTTRSYKQLAAALSRPEAVRAVAHANGMNRICILIPCHRVIGEDGHLTGYGGGLSRKQWLLDLERGAHPDIIF